MEDKIEVGEYVRTIGGEVGRNVKYENSKYNIEVGKNKIWEFSKNFIVKHSKQLIDLIENKDVLKVRIDKTIMVFGMDEDTSDIKYKELIENIENGEYELLEILTHEQFETNCYKVGGEDE